MEGSGGASVLLGSSGIFVAIYLLAYYWWAARGRIKSGETGRHEAASCFMSLLHGSLVTLLTSLDVAHHLQLQAHKQEPWQLLLRAPNTSFQNLIMEFSLAYFLVDLLHYTFFVPEEFLFILHHLATSTYMLSCRYYTTHGGFSVMALLGLAECTSILQNLWTLSSISGATGMFCFLSRFFLPFFSLVRGFLGPLLTWHLCAYYFTGHADAVIPRWLAYYWMSTVILAISGSIYWVSRLWIKYFELQRAVSKSKRLE